MSKKNTTQAEAPKADEQPKQSTAQAATGTASQQKITPVSKISVKTVCGTPDAAKLPPLRINISDANPEGEANPDAEVRVMRLAGYISGVNSGTSTYGEWRALVGEHTAINIGTGEIFASKTAIIPGPMNDMLYEAAQGALAEDASARVAYKVDVFVRRSARDAKKHEYAVRPVIETTFQSPALALLTAD
jgi:hypothetical protein